MRTEHLGPDELLVCAKVEFDHSFTSRRWRGRRRRPERTCARPCPRPGSCTWNPTSSARRRPAPDAPSAGRRPAADRLPTCPDHDPSSGCGRSGPGTSLRSTRVGLTGGGRMRMVGTVALDAGRAPGARCPCRRRWPVTCVRLRRTGHRAAAVRCAGARARRVAAALRGPAGRRAGDVVPGAARTVGGRPWTCPARASPGLHTGDASRRAGPPRAGRPSVDAATASCSCPPTPRRPGSARAFLRRAAGEWGVDDDARSRTPPW